jgi:hypothetical protein
MEDLKYPIGRFDASKNHNIAEIKAAIEILSHFPSDFRKVAESLTEKHLDTPYRPEGWTGRQVIHHVADSHIHMYTRLKFALLEENPTIKGYSEEVWALQPDVSGSIGSSLSIISGLHERLVLLLNSLKEEDFERSYYHAGYQKSYYLKNVVPLYAWHSNHHLAHLKIILNA